MKSELKPVKSPLTSDKRGLTSLLLEVIVSQIVKIVDEIFPFIYNTLLSHDISENEV